MFEHVSEAQIWILFAAAVAIAFYWGRASAGHPAEARARLMQLARAAAAEDFRRLPDDRQAEVDRLIAAGKIVAAVKLIRATLGVGLYEAKQVVDLRKAGG
jgi:ribosomal protein L7/L12